MDNQSSSSTTITTNHFSITFSSPGPLGLSLVPVWIEPTIPEINTTTRKRLPFPRVVVQKIIPNQQAALDGKIQPGDEILSLQGKSLGTDFNTYEDLLAWLRTADRPVTLELLRPSRSLLLTSSSSQQQQQVSIPKPLSIKERIMAREEALTNALNRPVIVLDEIREFARSGLSEKRRAVCWRLLLGYLPEDRSKWVSELTRQRNIYFQLVKELLPNPNQQQHPQPITTSSPKSDDTEQNNTTTTTTTSTSTTIDSRPARMGGQAWFEQGLTKSSTSSSKLTTMPIITTANHQPITHDISSDSIDPLSPLEQSSSLPSTTQTGYQSNSNSIITNSNDTGNGSNNPADDALDEDIWKDVQRTHPGLHFFTQSTYERMRRILYVFAKLNPGIKYIQGMNEVLAPIVFIFGSDVRTAILTGSGSTSSLSTITANNSNNSTTTDNDSLKWSMDDCEADAFFCFTTLMGDVRDLFIRNLDSSSTGLKGQIRGLNEMLSRHDYQLSTHLEELEVQFQFFAIRWLTTLLTREFDLPDAVRLWDSLLADSRRIRFIQCACTALLVLQRKELLEGDFATCIKTLQTPVSHSLSVEAVLKEAERISDVEEQIARGGGNFNTNNNNNNTNNNNIFLDSPLLSQTTTSFQSLFAGIANRVPGSPPPTNNNQQQQHPVWVADAKAFFSDVKKAAENVGKAIANEFRE
jgi:hypothetical protein